MPPVTNDQEPLRTAIVLAAELQSWFSGTSRRWAIVGWVGRSTPRHKNQPMPSAKGPRHVQHLIIPAPSSGPGGNAVWDRARELLALGKLKPFTLASGQLSTPDVETVALELWDSRGWRHTIIRTTRESWGYRHAEAIGPAGYFAMLRHRLELAGTLKL